MIEKIYLAIVLLAFSAFFSMSETALASVNRIKLRGLIEKNVKSSKTVKNLKDNMQRTLTGILVGNNLVNIALASMVTAMAFDYFNSNAIAIATGATTLVVLIFGEIIPKSFATHHSMKISLAIAKPIEILGWILSPGTYLLDKIRKIFIKDAVSKKLSLTEEDLKTCITIGRESGNIKEIEKKLIQNIFKFDEINASEIMTPRKDVFAVEVNKKLKDVIVPILKANYTRIPVYEKSLDKIVGILNMKDLVKNRASHSLKKLMIEPYFVPENKKIHSLLKQFQKRQEHMAIVIDEHGLVVGLVTLENVIEEIVGEIKDETDRIDPHVVNLGKGLWKVLGKSDIEEVNKKIKGLALKESEDYDTISGYILNRLGRFPKEGEEIEEKKFVTEVTDISDHRIVEVKIKKK